MLSYFYPRGHHFLDTQRCLIATVPIHYPNTGGMSVSSPLVMIIYVTQDEDKAGSAVEEASQQSEHEKVCATRST